MSSTSTSATTTATTRRKLPRIGAAILPLAILLFDRTAMSTSPSGYYVLTGGITDGTALDTRTGIRWERGFAVGGNGSRNYADGAAACQALMLNGMNGWRRPVEMLSTQTGPEN